MARQADNKFYRVGYSQAISELKNLLSEIKTCADNSCMLKVTRGGVGTNGGCRCDPIFFRQFAMITRRFIRDAEDRIK